MALVRLNQPCWLIGVYTIYVEKAKLNLYKSSMHPLVFNLPHCKDVFLSFLYKRTKAFAILNV